MKKFLAMLLAAMMLLSCAGAMAEGYTTVDGYDVKNDSELTVKDGVTSTFMDESTTTGEVDTELWLQVAADGQIDVTVPLVLIFSTNVDGGEATEAENYKITNNNKRSSISVDKIAVTTNPNNGHMTLVSSDEDVREWDSTTRDEYYVTLTPSTEYEGEDATKDFTDVVFDLYDITVSPDDYDETGDNKDSVSIFRIGENSNVLLTAKMVTTPLTFVTGNIPGNSKYLDRGEGNYSAGAEKGIELLTITYTVGLEYDTVQYGIVTDKSEEYDAEDIAAEGFQHTHYNYN